MRRQRDDMQVNVAGLRRNIKNLAHNYSDAQIKVREATSNDPWGPSSTLMSEIADLTYNVVAFTEIMQMVWKRLNDHGRNWRHVYKALVLLEYLIKTGSEKVAQQCKENIFAIQTLKDFQYYEENKDQGMNVREKAKQLVQLLKDEERLRNERARALKAKERFAQAASGFGSDGSDGGMPTSPSFPPSQWATCASESASRVSSSSSPELETARPQTVGEEELQLQLALAMSREEAEQEEQRRRSDDVRLQLALSQSEQEFKCHQPVQQSHMQDLLDLLDVAPSSPAKDPWGFPQPVQEHISPISRPQNDPWSSQTSVPSLSTATSSSPPQDPWTPASIDSARKTASPPQDPWTPASIDSARKTEPASNTWRAISPNPLTSASTAHMSSVQDPWSPATNTEHSSPSSGAGDLDEFDIITNRANVNSINNNGGTLSPSPFDMSGLGDSLSDDKQTSIKKTPHSFLGENSSLVNLDNLVAVGSKPAMSIPPPAPPSSLAMANPFAGVGTQQTIYSQQTGPAVHPRTSSPWGVSSVLPPSQPNPFLS